MKYKKLVNIIFNYITDIIYIFCTVVLLWIYQPNYKIEIKYLVMILIPLAIITVTSTKYILKRLIEEKQGVLPKIRSINDASLVLEPNEFFAQDSFVCLYLFENEFERYVGYGYVETIQTNSKNIQIKIESIEKNYKKYLNDKYRNKIFVKPGINRQIIINQQLANTEEGV